MTLDRSPGFCFKRLIYSYLLETGYTPGDPPDGPCLVPNYYLIIFNVVHQVMLLTKHQGSRSSGFRQEDCFYVFTT